MTEILIDQTGQPEVIAASDGSLTVTVPIRIKRRGLRKVVTLPDGDAVQPCPWDSTPTPLKLALARGHRWLALLKSGEVNSMKEIARREGVDESYVSRMVNMTTLEPDIVAAILDETLPPEVTLFELAAGTPLPIAIFFRRSGNSWSGPSTPARLDRANSMPASSPRYEYVRAAGTVAAWRKIFLRQSCGRLARSPSTKMVSFLCAPTMSPAP
jgi:hypothetical protein